MAQLSHSFSQRFMGGANSPDSESLAVWYALSHTRRVTSDTSSLSEGVLSTDLYSKPTETNQYILHVRCHPPRVTKSIP
jgi:hypothetical protein